MGKLVKTNDRILLGVCGALANYFNIDSTVVRILMTLFICCTGCGLLAYIIAGILIPRD